MYVCIWNSRCCIKYTKLHIQLLNFGYFRFLNCHAVRIFCIRYDRNVSNNDTDSHRKISQRARVKIIMKISRHNFPSETRNTFTFPTPFYDPLGNHARVSNVSTILYLWIFFCDFYIHPVSETFRMDPRCQLRTLQ